ncbi:MAG: hypothetical protein JSR62_08170 [Nitrospira sp.]|nr:hypothetical protein [Nitrospira sp.]
MPEHELEQLLGGFAAGTLTADEQQRLYAAALQDQRLFNALADEQSLKELLAEPEVRRRLLDVLQQSRTQTAEPSASWWAWFRTPAGLAWAGGLAAALFAVTFGTRIYQEGLDRQARSVSTEEPGAPAPPKPSPSQASPPAPPASEPVALEKKDSTNRIRSTTQKASRDTAASQPHADASQRAAIAESSQPDQHARVSQDRSLSAETPGPPTPAAAPMLKPAPSALSGAGAPVPAKGARALYYADASTKLLGLRYSFAIRGVNGQNQEVSAAIAARSKEPMRLVVETTVDGYLQLLQNLGSAGTRLWWPPQETGKISLKATARTRIEIPMPPSAESGLLDLVLRLSPKPFGPLTMQEVGMLDRFSGNLVIETVTSGEVAGVEESATYVVNPEATPAAQLAVDIPVSR